MANRTNKSSASSLLDTLGRAPEFKNIRPKDAVRNLTIGERFARALSQTPGS